MTEAGASVHCRCRRAIDFFLHSFDDGVVVYDEADGSLHALNPVAGEALQHLISHAAGLRDEDLARLMLQDEPEVADLDQVRGLLEGLVSLGFAEHVPT
ncbi:MAG: hypothetical protein C0449_02345 [Polaromonas sp.]|nr:hypothetical protein [Polaromonas sp.]